jgi:L-histidine Nalpha-methyltransferase
MKTKPIPTNRPSPTVPPSPFLREVLDGLRRPRKELPCKYFYDDRGAELFEQICELDEYYLTRSELAILERHAPEMAERIGAGATLIEYGSGSGRKTLLLLDHLDQPVAYVPVDVNPKNLAASARQLAERYPALKVAPVCADFTKSFDLPTKDRSSRRVVYFSGSTIGNFGPAEAMPLLANIVRLVGPGGGLLIAADLRKDRRILEAAYDDGQGVTAAFNLNLLAHVNRELGADFDLERFKHCAFFNKDESRIEMHLVSLADQTVRIDGEAIPFRAGETIHTENSYKYTLDSFADMARQAGLRVERVWTDERGLFSVQYCSVAKETR